MFSSLGRTNYIVPRKWPDCQEWVDKITKVLEARSTWTDMVINKAWEFNDDLKLIKLIKLKGI